MALKDLHFAELFRKARIRELRENILTRDPRANGFANIYNTILEDKITQEDFDKCIEKGLGEIIMYISFDSDLFNEENLIKAVSCKPSVLGYIPANKQTVKILEAAFSKDSVSSLPYASYELLTDDLILKALDQNPNCKGTLMKIYSDFVESN